MKDRFYLASTRDIFGPNLSFHGISGYSYVTDVDKAKVYTREEAQRAWDFGRDFDVPVSADHVDAATTIKVDMQYINSQNEFPKDCDCFVAYKRGSYSGNDVYWLNEGGSSCLSFDLAKKLSSSEIRELNLNIWIIIPFESADKVKRRTFEYGNYKPRKMTQGAGIIKPKHAIKSRRKVNAKTMYNCTSCGQAVWDENPYRLDYSDEVFCGKCE